MALPLQGMRGFDLATIVAGLCHW